ncbi:MAG: SCO family protein [Kiloniellales bacterium]|nr:SCO family protein [Kiloniellales bacterium]
MTPVRIGVLGVLALLVLGGGWMAWQKLRPPLVVGPTTTVGTVAIGGPFALTDQTGARRSDADYLGRYMLVYFGYTYCPDICPTSLLTMSRGLQLLAERSPDAAEQVVPVFITVDPERDTVDALAAYAPSFHPDLVALTGSADEIAAAAKAYRVYYAKAEDEASGTYLMDHSSFFYLMGPDGAYRTHFSHTAPAEEIAEGLERHIGS